jgi:hypothetical protein
MWRQCVATVNWPGLLDAAVAGHLLTGESYRDATREIRAEIGVPVQVETAIAWRATRGASSAMRSSQECEARAPFGAK